MTFNFVDLDEFGKYNEINVTDDSMFSVELQTIFWLTFACEMRWLSTFGLSYMKIKYFAHKIVVSTLKCE